MGRRRSDDRGPGVPGHQDKNQQFVAAMCARYLGRVLSLYPLLNQEAITFLHWVLGPATDAFALRMVELARAVDRGFFEEEVLPCSTDPEEYPNALAEGYKKIPKGRRSTLLRFTLQLLRHSESTLKRRGKSDVEKNVDAVKRMFRLTDHETRYCLFRFISAAWTQPRQYFETHLRCNIYSGRPYVMTALDMSRSDLDQVLTGTLQRIGMLENDGFDQEVTIASNYLQLFQDPASGFVSKNFFTPLKAKSIPLENHMVGGEQTAHILALLRKKPAASTHILLYGPPGTGKTSYAWGIGRKLGIPTYEIARGNEENASKARRAAILACLNMTNSGPGSLVIVDEADNVLNTSFSFFTRGETQDKGWLNQLLEEPGVRMIWITNHIQGIEESVLRRFSFSLHFKAFNRSQRITLWKSVLGQNKAGRLLPESKIRNLARTYAVSAGAMDTAVKKALQASPEDRENFHTALKMNLEAHRTLLNGGITVRDKEQIEQSYSLEGLNTEGDLESMISQLGAFDRFLRESGSDSNRGMNLLFYGPPGTGKSELARYVATTLNRELICKRASDLLDPYVGMTEQRLAQAFFEAETQDAVLVMDEVDSILAGRDRAHHSWEISFTNELLSQMERFRGILICTTNRLMDLDQASIRRFNFKIGFNYLTPEGNVLFYRKLLAPLTNVPLDPSLADELRMIADLAPGDFRVVRDRCSLSPSEQVTHDGLVSALREEARVKKTHKGEREIGF
jgi:transitional endoplasmic reticulum ATPase